MYDKPFPSFVFPSTPQRRSHFYQPAPSGLADILWGNNAIAFALLMRRNIAPEMPRPPYPKSRIARLPPKVVPENGLSRFVRERQSFDTPLVDRPTVAQRTDRKPSSYMIPESKTGVAPKAEPRTLSRILFDELKIRIGGPTGYLAREPVKQTSNIPPFSNTRPRATTDSLVLNWAKCAVDNDGSGSKPIRYDYSIPLTTFKRISIKVPRIVTFFNLIGMPPTPTDESDAISINLKGASDLTGFYWTGDFGIFALKFCNTPLHVFILLSLNDCVTLTVNDTIGFLNSCPNLKELALGTIYFCF